MEFLFVDRCAPIDAGGVPAFVVVSKDRELSLFFLTIAMVCALFCACSLLLMLVLVDGFVGLSGVVVVVDICC